MACLALAAGAICLHVEAAPQPWRSAKGLIRKPRNTAVPVGTITPEMLAAAPAKLDWTETSGATTAVRNEGYCGSTWAITATEAIESGFFVSTGSASPVLSPQQIVSCDQKDNGCEGGDLPSAWDYVVSAGGLDTEENYPYTSATGDSGSCQSFTPVVTVTEYKYAVPPCQSGSCTNQDEDGLKAALATHGPLSIIVDSNFWYDYEGGVFKGGRYGGNCSSAWDKRDHAGLLVGYDTTAPTPYWKVKNQWGTSWGEDGFIRLPMGANACGLANEAMYVKASLVTSVV